MIIIDYYCNTLYNNYCSTPCIITTATPCIEYSVSTPSIITTTATQLTIISTYLFRLVSPLRSSSSSCSSSCCSPRLQYRSPPQQPATTEQGLGKAYIQYTFLSRTCPQKCVGGVVDLSYANVGEEKDVTFQEPCLHITGIAVPQKLGIGT